MSETRAGAEAIFARVDRHRGSMAVTAELVSMSMEQNERIVADVARERSRLRQMIRRYVMDESDVEDILQDVFSELIESYRLFKPIEQVGAWLYQVTRNRIVDRFRSRQREISLPQQPADAEGTGPTLESLLPDADAGPEAAFARQVLLEQILIALDELPHAQREVFVAHELEGLSFKEMAARSGVGVNTLLARKHDAVRNLRRRLRDMFDDYTNRSF